MYQYKVWNDAEGIEGTKLIMAFSLEGAKQQVKQDSNYRAADQWHYEVQVNVAELTYDQLKEALRSQGYAYSSLWSLDDVQRSIDDYNEEHGTEYSMTEKEKWQVLEDVFGFDADKSADNEQIDDKVRSCFEIDPDAAYEEDPTGLDNDLLEFDRIATGEEDEDHV